MSVQDIINGAGNIQRTIKGIKEVHTDIPSNPNLLPCFVNMPDEGKPEWPRVPGRSKKEHNIKMDLLVQEGGDLKAADRLLKPYIDLVIDTFDQNITLGGSCLRAGVTHYKYATIKYGDVPYLGISFTLTAEEYKQLAFKA